MTTDTNYPFEEIVHGGSNEESSTRCDDHIAGRHHIEHPARDAEFRPVSNTAHSLKLLSSKSWNISAQSCIVLI